jgi:hypothetical protein
MADLEQALRELRIDWPGTPDLASSVRARLQPRPRRRPWKARIAIAIAVLLGATMAIEPARSAILEALGLKGARIERKEPTATPSPPQPGATLGEGLGLGEPVTLERATRDAGFAFGVPGAGLGPPDAVYLDQGRVSFVYRAGGELPRSAETGAGLLVTESRALVAPFIEKAAGPGTRIERLTIDGDPAYRLSGAPHGFAYQLEGEDVRFEEQRLAGSTLLVEHDGLLLRIEGRIPRERAIEIAESIVAAAG